MRFRLYYEGELKATQRDPRDGEINRVAQHKQTIRRAFHRQLRQLWNTNRFLREYKRNPDADIAERPAGDAGAYFDHEPDTKIPLSQYLAQRYQKFGYRFVPLVRDEISLLCSLHVLFLRRDTPGSIIQAGDIDNRIKTLIDALRAPNSPNELVGNDTNPGSDDDPFYCLLWNDNQVSRLSVETDTLLDQPTSGDADARKVRLIITVDLQPYDVTLFNLSFAGA